MASNKQRNRRQPAKSDLGTISDAINPPADVTTTDAPQPAVTEPQPEVTEPQPEVTETEQVTTTTDDNDPQPTTPAPDVTGAAAMLQAVGALVAASQQALGVPGDAVPTDDDADAAAQQQPVKLHGGIPLTQLPKHIVAIATSKRGEPTVVPKDLSGVVLLPGKPVKSRVSHSTAWSTKAMELAGRKGADGAPLGTTAEELVAAGIPLHNVKYMVHKTGWLKVAAAPAAEQPQPPTTDAPKVVLTAEGAAVGLPTQQETQEQPAQG